MLWRNVKLSEKLITSGEEPLGETMSEISGEDDAILIDAIAGDWVAGSNDIEFSSFFYFFFTLKWWLEKRLSLIKCNVLIHA